MPTRVRDVTGCSRCGEDHSGVEFRDVTCDPPIPWDWLGFCPTTGEPVLARPHLAAAADERFPVPGTEATAA